MTEMLGLSDKDFKAAIVKMFQWAITNVLETNKKGKSQQRSRWYKEELNGNFRTKKTYTNQNLKTQLMDSITEWIWRCNNPKCVSQSNRVSKHV